MVMTRAVVATAFGGPEVLSIVDVELPEPGPGEVTIEVRAAGVNPVDVKVYSGAFGSDPARLPMRLGAEAAGLVTAVGPTGALHVGDEVIAYRVSGAYAERIVVPAASVLHKPATLDWPAAAGLMLVGVTAEHALEATAVTAGDTVLVHGFGGVGIAAVQLGVARGARMIATASPGRHDHVRAAGGEPVAYGPGLADRVRALAPTGVQAAVDTVGSDEAVDASLELVPVRSRIATIAAFSRAADAGIKALGGGPGADPGTAIRNTARLRLLRLVDEGRLAVTVAATYPLDAVRDAHEASRSGRTPGKIALIP
jgi:NADPH:quinone reductase-like Zn-dependent oxidoreductase